MPNTSDRSLGRSGQYDISVRLDPLAPLVSNAFHQNRRVKSGKIQWARLAHTDKFREELFKLMVRLDTLVVVDVTKDF